MLHVTPSAGAPQTLFTTTAEQLAGFTSFIRCQRKLIGPQFALEFPTDWTSLRIMDSV